MREIKEIENLAELANQLYFKIDGGINLNKMQYNISKNIYKSKISTDKDVWSTEMP